MFNQSLKIMIEGAAPYAHADETTERVGIVIAGTVDGIPESQIARLPLGSRSAGIAHIVGGSLPTDEPVKLAFSPIVDDLRLKFPGIEKSLACELVEVSAGPSPSMPSRKTSEETICFAFVKLKIRIPDTTPESAGQIVSRLKHAVDIEIVRLQEELDLRGTGDGRVLQLPPARRLLAQGLIKDLRKEKPKKGGRRPGSGRRKKTTNNQTEDRTP